MTKQKNDTKQAFIAKQKKEYTIKVTTILKTLVLVSALGISFVAGWNARSDFANEVKSEVRNQMSVLDTVKNTAVSK